MPQALDRPVFLYKRQPGKFLLIGDFALGDFREWLGQNVLEFLSEELAAEMGATRPFPKGVALVVIHPKVRPVLAKFLSELALRLLPKENIWIYDDAKYIKRWLQYFVRQRSRDYEDEGEENVMAKRGSVRSVRMAPRDIKTEKDAARRVVQENRHLSKIQILDKLHDAGFTKATIYNVTGFLSRMEPNPVPVRFDETPAGVAAAEPETSELVAREAGEASHGSRSAGEGLGEESLREDEFPEIETSYGFGVPEGAEVGLRPQVKKTADVVSEAREWLKQRDRHLESIRSEKQRLKARLAELDQMEQEIIGSVSAHTAPALSSGREEVSKESGTESTA